MIDGKRVRLRAMEPDDLEIIWRWNNDWAAQRLGDDAPELAVSRDAVAGKIRPDQSGSGPYMIELLDGHRAIGNCGYYNYSSRNRHCSVGIWIGEADARGKGYGTEAMRLLLDYLFRQVGLHRVALDVVADNRPAIASYRKCGFREEGRDREAVFKDGGWVDRVRMAVLDREAIFEASRNGDKGGDI